MSVTVWMNIPIRKIPIHIRERRIEREMPWISRAPYLFSRADTPDGFTILEGWTFGKGRWQGKVFRTRITLSPGYPLDPPWVLWYTKPEGMQHLFSGDPDIPGSVIPCITILPPVYGKYWNPENHSLKTVIEMLEELFY